MAEFLTTKGISARLEQVIRNANKRLVLISPYLQINQKLKDLLEYKDRSNIQIHVIYGKTNLKTGEKDWLASKTSIKLHYRENLHAKCYLNENEALLTSMNLYEFSQVNNDEMGISVSREADTELYKKIREEADWLLDISEDIPSTVAKVANKENGKKSSRAQAVQRKPQQTPEPPKSGFCIRCKATVPVNTEDPYCRSCRKSWNRYKNKEYGEQYCHTCGKEHSTMLVRPLCPTCHKKYKNLFTFVRS